jgi:DNA-directed RNA polymerase subunit beta
MITIKSDDVAGRTQAYEAIIKWAPIKKPNIPESFNVLIKELQAIWLDVDLLDNAELSDKEKELRERYEEIVKIENEVINNDEVEKKEEK